MRRVAALLVAAAASWGSASAAQIQPTSAPPSGTPILPLSEVRAGMRAVVRTVLQGDTIEELPAEVLGVMENSLGPAQSLILLRVNGEKAAFTGVAAGMSGSPVLVDGKLIGALSYRLGQFSKEAIAGVTPIEYMLSLASAPTPGSGRASGSGGSPFGAASSRLSAFAGSGLSAPPAPETSGDSIMTPIETPLVVTGVPAQLVERFLSPLRAMGGVAVAGAGGSAPQGAPSQGAPTQAAPPHARPLRAGDAVSAQLVRGDLSLAATGTVTWVDGDKVLAFGHPFLMSGAAGFPMARAEIYHTLASLAASTKLARIGETIGTWDQIRLPGLFGVTGRVPDMIPMSVTVKSPGRTSSFRYEVANHRDWTPNFVALSVAGSLVNTPAFADESTLSVTGRVEIEGHPTVVIEDLYTGMGPQASAAVAVAADVQGIFGAVFQNKFEAPKVKSISLIAEGVEEGRVSTVEGVWPSRSEGSPGDTIQYHVRVSSFRGQSAVKTFSFTIPENTPRGDLQVYIGGSSFMVSAERQMLARQISGAEDLDQIIGIVNKLRTSDALYAKVARRLPGAVVQSEVLPALPPSVLTTLRSNRSSGDVAPLTEAAIWESKIPLPSIVSGGTTLTLKVR